MITLKIRNGNNKDQVWIRKIFREYWGSEVIVTRGKAHQADQLQAVIAEINGKPVGLLTYRIENRECEITSLNSLWEKHGIGTALMKAAYHIAVTAGCKRLWLITTNDNTPAMEFYEHRGYKKTAVHKNAIEISRKLKPEIPKFGVNRVPIKDEIEYEMVL
ncbi:GNAT family N-acetyltransferase [bacterium]|nr:GNAT family N-acetyltransferase [bacterium]